VNAIRRAQVALKVLKKVDKEIDVDHYVNDKFIRQAAREFGYDYDTRLADYHALPFQGNALDTDAPVTDPTLAGQIWVKGEPKVRLCSTVRATFSALKKLTVDGSAVRVTFVHDRVSGNKLFADKVWYVADKGSLAAFLLKTTASDWAAKHGGSVVNFATAQQGVL
jgi:NitT/TauT family transport system substrate-binding protein